MQKKQMKNEGKRKKERTQKENKRTTHATAMKESDDKAADTATVHTQSVNDNSEPASESGGKNEME